MELIIIIRTVVLNVRFPRPAAAAAAASKGNLLETKSLGLHLKPTESENLGVGSSNVSMDPPGDSGARSRLRTTRLEY